MGIDQLAPYIKLSRDRAGMSRKAAGACIGVSHKSIEAYEHGRATPAPDIIMSMARTYDDATLPKRYCKQMCAIGNDFGYVRLNNVNLDVATILLKLRQEYDEAGVALSRMMTLTINKRTRKDFTEAEIAELKACSHEIHDVVHNAEELHLQLDQLKWISEAEMVSEHNSKCYRQGYVVNENNLPQAG